MSPTHRHPTGHTNIRAHTYRHTKESTRACTHTRIDKLMGVHRCILTHSGTLTHGHTHTSKDAWTHADTCPYWHRHTICTHGHSNRPQNTETHTVSHTWEHTQEHANWHTHRLLFSCQGQHRIRSFSTEISVCFAVHYNESKFELQKRRFLSENIFPKGQKFLSAFFFSLWLQLSLISQALFFFITMSFLIQCKP